MGYLMWFTAPSGTHNLTFAMADGNTATTYVCQASMSQTYLSAG